MHKGIFLTLVKIHIQFPNYGLYYILPLLEKAHLQNIFNGLIPNFRKTYLMILSMLLWAGVLAWNRWVTTFYILNCFCSSPQVKEQIHWRGCIMHFHRLICTHIYFIKFYLRITRTKHWRYLHSNSPAFPSQDCSLSYYISYVAKL